MMPSPLKLRPLAAACCVALAVAASPAWAADDGMWSFSGFATLGAVRTSSDDAHYVVPGQPSGATTTASTEVDSKLGLQLTGKFNTTFSATAQLLSKYDGDGSFKPVFEWAFVKAQVMPSLAIRAGRMGAPFFAVSDFRDVGYTSVWARPPIDVYGQVPVSHFDGADVLYQTDVGGVTLTGQVLAGKSDARVERTPVRLRNLVGMNATAEWPFGVTLRLGYVQARLSLDSAGLSELVSLLKATPFASVGQELDVTDKASSFAGVGLSWDHENWVGGIEYTQRKTDSYIPSTTGWYANFGYRWGKFTPYLALSSIKVDSNNVNNNIPVGVDPGLDTLKYTVDGVLESQRTEQRTTALGVRWDFYRNFALKVQVDNIKPDGVGLFTKVQQGFGRSDVRAYSLVVDTVF